MYEIDFDDVSRRLEVKLRGFWSAETMNDFSQLFKQKISAAKAKYGAFDIVIDTIDFSVQSAEIVSRFRDLIGTLDMASHGRLAVVVGTMLNKAQAERTEGGPSTKIFRDRSTAVQWLSAAE